MSQHPPRYEWDSSDYARLPDDGNRYEVIDGEVLVTPRRPTTSGCSSTGSWTRTSGRSGCGASLPARTEAERVAGTLRWQAAGARTPFEITPEELFAPMF